MYKHLVQLLLSVLILACASCANSGSSGGPPLTKQECEAVLRKGWELQGISVETMFSDEAGKKAWDVTVQGCAKDHEISRKDYDCLIKATNMDEHEACHAAIHVR